MTVGRQVISFISYKFLFYFVFVFIVMTHPEILLYDVNKQNVFFKGSGLSLFHTQGRIHKRIVGFLQP